MANKIFLKQDNETAGLMSFYNNDSALSEMDSSGYPHTITGVAVGLNDGECTLDKDGNVWYAPHAQPLTKINTKSGAVTTYQAGTTGYRHIAYDAKNHQLIMASFGNAIATYDIATNAFTSSITASIDYIYGIFVCPITFTHYAICLSGVLDAYSHRAIRVYTQITGGSWTLANSSSLEYYNQGLCTAVTFTADKIVVFLPEVQSFVSNHHTLITFDYNVSSITTTFASANNTANLAGWVASAHYIGNNSFLCVPAAASEFQIHKFAADWSYIGYQAFPFSHAGYDYAFFSSRVLLDGRVLCACGASQDGLGWWYFDTKTNTISQRIGSEGYHVQDFSVLPDGRVVYYTNSPSVQNYVKTFIEPCTMSLNLSLHGAYNKH